MNQTNPINEITCPILRDYLERILFLAQQAQKASNDEEAMNALFAIEDAARVGVLEFMESIAPECNEQDIPF